MKCQPINSLIDEAACWGAAKGEYLMDAFGQGADWTAWARTELGLHFAGAFSNIDVSVQPDSKESRPAAGDDSQGEEDTSDHDCDEEGDGGSDTPGKKAKESAIPSGSLVLKVLGKQDICIDLRCECASSEVTLEKSSDGKYKGLLGEILGFCTELDGLDRNKYVPLAVGIMISNTSNDYAKVALCDGAGFVAQELYTDDQGVAAVLYFKCV